MINDLIWPFPIHNGERTEASKMLILKSREQDDRPLEFVLEYTYPINTDNEEDALL